MVKKHKNVLVFVLSCKFKHESTKTCMFSCKISIWYLHLLPHPQAPLHHKGSDVVSYVTCHEHASRTLFAPRSSAVFLST